MSSVFGDALVSISCPSNLTSIEALPWLLAMVAKTLLTTADIALRESLMASKSESARRDYLSHRYERSSKPMRGMPK